MRVWERAVNEKRPPRIAAGVKQARVMRLCARRPETRASDFVRITGFIAQLSPRDSYRRVRGCVSFCITEYSIVHSV